jgi:hypothetical protein
MGLERGPLGLVSTTDELLRRKVAAPVYKTENTAVGIRHADHVATSTLKKLAITSPTSGGRSVSIVRSRTQTMEFSFGIETWKYSLVVILTAVLTADNFSNCNQGETLQYWVHLTVTQ